VIDRRKITRLIVHSDYQEIRNKLDNENEDGILNRDFLKMIQMCADVVQKRKKKE